jgi:hypothetical protein
MKRILHLLVSNGLLAVVAAAVLAVAAPANADIVCGTYSQALASDGDDGRLLLYGIATIRRPVLEGAPPCGAPSPWFEQEATPAERGFREGG